VSTSRPLDLSKIKPLLSVRRLKRENARLQQENAFLKGAAA